MITPNLLKFNYINHRGEDHEYVIKPFSIDFGKCKCFADEPEKRAWFISGSVVTRDDEARPGQRDFAIIKMREVTEVHVS